MIEQNYEDYWKLTLAYTDINSEKFYNTLNAIVQFINFSSHKIISDNYYSELQNYVSSFNGLSDTSLRKSINQFVKLGFINNLSSFNYEAIEFLESKSNRKRQSIFSKVVYKYSTFSSSITNYNPQREINFLLKTLEEVGSLSKENIIGLMTVNISKFQEGFLNKFQIEDVTNYANRIGFIDRKYNQIDYLLNLLKKLDDIVFIDNTLYFMEDAKVLFGEDLKKESRKRDSYLHRIYKNLLKEEVEEKTGFVKCMLENFSYPSLVASHIKPFIDSNDIEAYDPDNGLLLSRNMDILFDQGYITFDNAGVVICSDRLEVNVNNYLKHFNLDGVFLSPKRLDYLDYHRRYVFR